MTPKIYANMRRSVQPTQFFEQKKKPLADNDVRASSYDIIIVLNLNPCRMYALNIFEYIKLIYIYYLNAEIYRNAHHKHVTAVEDKCPRVFIRKKDDEHLFFCNSQQSVLYGFIQCFVHVSPTCFLCIIYGEGKMLVNIFALHANNIAYACNRLKFNMTPEERVSSSIISLC